MLLQTQLQADSIKIAKDTLNSAASDDAMLNSLAFDVSNVGNAEVVLTVLGYGIVFLALLTLYIFITNLTKVILSARRKKLKAAGKKAADFEDLTVPGETSAAISLALHLHFQEVHDIENTIITIKKMQSSYSPWNSKLYGLRQNPKY